MADCIVLAILMIGHTAHVLGILLFQLALFYHLCMLCCQQLQRVVEEAESRYRAALQSAREELCSRHAREKEALMLQLRQLEGRLGRVLQEQEQEREQGSKECSRCGRGQLELMEERVQQVLEQWRANMTCSVKILVSHFVIHAPAF